MTALGNREGPLRAHIDRSEKISRGWHRPGADHQVTLKKSSNLLSRQVFYVDNSAAQSIMSLIEEIRAAWGWAGIEPAEVVGENDFGNLLIRDSTGKCWRICPEELECRVVAADREALDALSKDQEFLSDWYMKKLIELAQNELGQLASDRKYCLKIPGVLGGTYEGGNFASMSLDELIRSSGYLAQEIKGLSDGTKIRLSSSD